MPFEFDILNWINQHLTNSSFFNEIMRIITFMGDRGWIWILTGILLLSFKKTRFSGLILILSLACGTLINETLKHIIVRTRPIYVEGHENLRLFSMTWLSMDSPISYFFNIPNTASYSFPSGHTYSSFNCATILYLTNKKMGIASYILATFIAFSRLFFAVHFPTDILAGMLLGIGTGIAAFYLSKKLARKKEVILCDSTNI